MAQGQLVQLGGDDYSRSDRVGEKEQPTSENGASMTTELTRYDGMHHAIVAAHSIDDVAAIRNQAEA